MGSSKKARARAPVIARRELRLEASQRRQLEINEQEEQERVREFRLHQKRDHHRRWRTRSALRGGGTSTDEGGTTEPIPAEESNVNLNNVDDPLGGEHNVEVSAGGTETGEATEGNEEGLSETVDSSANDCDDKGDNVLTPRNRKICAAASKGVNYIMQLLDAGFTQEEKKMVFHRYFADERLRELDPEWTTAVLKLHSVATTTVESLKGALQTIRSTSIQGKTKVRNIVLTAAVSKGDSQRKIGQALGASRYLVRKAFKRRAEVDETGENLWAGGNRKRRSDALSAEDHASVCTWWESETRVSPNKRDVKRR